MGRSPYEMPCVWASHSAEPDRGASSTQASRKPWAVGPGVTPVSGRHGLRTHGSEGTGRNGVWALQSQPERAGSFQHFPPSVDLRCYQTTKPKSSMRGQPPYGGRSVKGFIWKRPHLFGLARIGFSRAAAVQAQALRRSPSLVPFYPSGSCWLSLQSLSRIGAPTLVSLRKGFPGPSMRLCTSPILWLAPPPPLPPHSALALPLCRLLSLRVGFSLLQGALSLWTSPPAPSVVLPRLDPELLTHGQG